MTGSLAGYLAAKAVIKDLRGFTQQRMCRLFPVAIMMSAVDADGKTK